MQYFLVLNDKKIEITGQSPVTIGSVHGDCKIKIDDRYVSRCQCTIVLSPEGNWIVDGDGCSPSRNGTQVNGLLLRCDSLKEINKGVEIFDNDLITIGTTQMRFLSTKNLQPYQPWKETSGFNSK